MKRAIVLFWIVAMCGCGSDRISLPKFMAAKPPVDHIAELKAVAKNRHMYYRIFCADWESDSNYQFQANLCLADCKVLFDDEGGKPRWMGSGATQQAAAETVLKKIDRDKPYDFGNRNKPAAAHKQCPPELSGGPSDN